MKTYIPLIALLCSNLILLNSCSISNKSVAKQKPDIENVSNNSFCFIQLNDGTIQQYSSLKLVTGVFITPHLLADNKVIINSNDIKAYQNDKFYAVSPKLLITDKTSFVATETLPGFAVRITKGKLNIYSRKFYNGSNTIDEYFLQNGENGQILAYSPEIMIDLVKDNAKAAEFYNSNLKLSPKAKKLLVTAEIYNNPQLISKNQIVINQ